MTFRSRLGSPSLSALLLSTVVGCGTGGSTGARSSVPLSYPYEAIDWNHNDIDRVHFLKKFSLADYGKVVVERVDTSACKLPDADENTHQAVVDALASSTSVLTETIRAKLKGTIPVESAAAGTTTTGKALILRSRITEVDPGSRAARYAAGMGAGRAQTFLRGQIIDSSNNQTLIEFDNAKATGWGGFFGGSYGKVFNKEQVELGDSIGNLLLAFASKK